MYQSGGVGVMVQSAPGQELGGRSVRQCPVRLFYISKGTNFGNVYCSDCAVICLVAFIMHVRTQFQLHLPPQRKTIIFT